MFSQDDLIKVVREHRVLWDKRQSEYRNRESTSRAWQSVADLLDCTVPEVQVKWKNLRDSFSRELKRLPKNQSTGEVDVSQYAGDWIFFKPLLFLKGVVRRRKKLKCAVHGGARAGADDDESVASPVSGSPARRTPDRSTYMNYDLDCFPPVRYESTETAVENLLYSEMLQKDDAPSDASTAGDAKIIKQNELVEMLTILERQKFDMLKKELEYEEDEDMNWFKSILPHLRTLPPFSKFQFRTKVQEMLVTELTNFNASQQSQPGPSSDPHEETS